MLIAEDLLLLLTDDDSGKLTGTASEVDVALGGAMLIELTLMGRVDVAGPSDSVRKGRLVVRDPSPTDDLLLDELLTKLDKKQGKRPRDVVAPLGKKLRRRLYERLVDRGLLRVESGKILGLFPTRRWPAEDTAHEYALRAEIATALQNGMTGNAKLASVIALLRALKVVHKVIDPGVVGLSKRDLKDSAKRIAEGNWASEAVRQAISSMNAAVLAATSSGAATTGSGS